MRCGGGVAPAESRAVFTAHRSGHEDIPRGSALAYSPRDRLCLRREVECLASPAPPSGVGSLPAT
jgi:hypothetical protein